VTVISCPPDDELKDQSDDPRNSDPYGEEVKEREVKAQALPKIFL